VKRGKSAQFVERVPKEYDEIKNNMHIKIVNNLPHRVPFYTPTLVMLEKFLCSLDNSIELCSQTIDRWMAMKRLNLLERNQELIKKHNVCKNYVLELLVLKLLNVNLLNLLDR
jgi:hypothetical protein